MKIELSPQNQGDWCCIISESEYSTTKAIAEMCGVNPSQFYDYINMRTEPRLKTKERIVKVMAEINKTKKLQKHPSYGYATESQIKRLQEIGICPERDLILKEISKQTSSRGKTK